MNRRWIYLAFVLSAAGLVWWAGNEPSGPSTGLWDLRDDSLAALIEPDAPWPPFAELALRVEPGEAGEAFLRGPGCEARGELLRAALARTAQGWWQVALAPAAPRQGCLAVEFLLRTAGEGRPEGRIPARVQGRVLLLGAERTALRNLRGRVVLVADTGEGVGAPRLVFRLQGEDRGGTTLTLEGTAGLESLPAPFR